MYGKLKSTLTLAALMLAPACAGKQEVGPAPDAPRFEYGRVRTTAQDLSSFTVTFDATAHNPTAAAITLQKATLELSTGDEILAEAVVELNLEVPAGGQADLTLPASVTYARSAEEIQAFAQTKSLPLLMEATVSVAGASPMSFSRAGMVRSPRLPYPTFGDPDAARQRNDAIAAVFRLAVHNDNPFEIKLDFVRYDLKVEGKSLSDGKLGLGQTIPPSSSALFEVPVDLTEAELPGLEVTVKEKNALDYELVGSIEIDGLSLPIDLESSIQFTAER
ncbi:MAG: LEA type 2 family protein [Deltaproteobacteria bacterium]|nr:LEA type 2 family protein [Deltaproteobacteria bacterium]